MRVSIFFIATILIFVKSFDIKNLISSNNNEGNFSNLLRFIKAISPKQQNFQSHQSFNEEEENNENQIWLMDRLASRKDLARILKTVYKMIAFKKIVKFFIILGFLFFIPVMNKNDISDTVVDLNNERDFDPFAYISE